MAIATVVALVGAVGTLALVRQRDFVPSYAADVPVRGDGTPAIVGRPEAPASPLVTGLGGEPDRAESPTPSA